MKLCHAIFSTLNGKTEINIQRRGHLQIPKKFTDVHYFLPHSFLHKGTLFHISHLQSLLTFIKTGFYYVALAGLKFPTHGLGWFLLGLKAGTTNLTRTTIIFSNSPAP